jgi:Transglutaminase-like superfamily
LQFWLQTDLQVNPMQISAPAPQSSQAATERCAEPATTPACFFSAHAYVCEFDDGAIILDLRTDTYLGIDAQHLSNLRARIGNWPDLSQGNRDVARPGSSATESLIADLLTREILTTLPTSRQSSTSMNPTTALTGATSANTRKRIPVAHIAQFSIAFVMVALCLRQRGLASLVDWLRRRQSSIHRGHSGTQENTVERLASFLWLRAWCYTAQRRCLFDSLVLSVYLTRGLIPCTLAIGVATKPFLAHAWVQIGESVLNDTAEHVQSFRRILSIGGE